LALQVLKTTPLIKAEQARRVYHLLVAGALGAFVYQIFNTDYWTGKMWLPIGLMLAAGYVLVRQDAVGQSNLDADDSGTG
jgi:hypothetical protein